MSHEKGFLTGELLVSRQENDVLRAVVLDTGKERLMFRSNRYGVMELEDSHIVEEGDRSVYYPHYNETVVELDNPRFHQDAFVTYRENVSVRYFLCDYPADHEMYVASQIEKAAYSPNTIVVEGTLYSVLDSLFVEGGTDFEEDTFLSLDARENSVRVENVQTGRVGAVSRETIDQFFEQNPMRGAIPVREPTTEGFVREFAAALESERGEGV